MEYCSMHHNSSRKNRKHFVPPRFVATGSPVHGESAFAWQFADANIYAERLALSVGWTNPFTFNNLLVEHGVTGESWTCPKHSFLAMFLCRCAERVIKPNGETAVWLADQLDDVCLDIDDLLILVRIDSADSQLPLYVEQIADFAARRDRAMELRKELVRLVGDLPEAGRQQPSPPTLRGPVVA